MAKRFFGPLDRVMRWLHLYTGLFLIPWMAIYATSAFCLNHQPKILELLDLDKVEWKILREVDAPPQDTLPEDQAAQAEAILAYVDLTGPHRVLPASNARQMIIMRMSSAGNYRVTYAHAQPSVRVERLQTPPSGTPGQRAQWQVMRTVAPPRAEAMPEDEAGQAEAILGQLEIAGPYRIVPDTPNDQLVILHESDFGTRRITWSHPKNQVKVERLVPFSYYRLMHSLHFRGGYGQRYWPELTWAVVVDVVAISMWIWIISGVYIWARRPKKRLLGGIVALGGSVLFIVLVIQLCR